jgi:pimeloyl-ACP methyl ester carboxylesterase
MKRTLGVWLMVVISILFMSVWAQAAPAEPQSVTANGIRINYVEQGAGEEVLVFVHGYTLSIAAWTTVLELLPEEYHAYTLDLRGHGQSGQPGSYQLSEFAEDIYAFTQELGIEKFTYVGHSMGGKIGYQFALDHQDLLNGLFLVAPTAARAYFLPPDERASSLAQMKMMFESPEIIRGGLAYQLTTPLSEELLNEIASDMVATDPVAREEIFGWFTGIKGTNLEPELHNIKVPTLLLAGAKDPHFLSDWEWRYASQIEGCRFEVWEDGGHMMPLDSPQRLVDLLVSFIEDVSKG